MASLETKSRIAGLFMALALPLPVLAQAPVAPSRRLPPVTGSAWAANREWIPPGGVTNATLRNAGNISASQATPISYPHSLSESNLPANQLIESRRRLSPSKPGLVQRIALTATLLGRNRPNDVQQTDIDVYGTLGVPMPTRESPLLITPGYQARFLNGPSTTDVPARLHDAYLQLRWLRRINERWALDVAISPGVHSDFESWNDEAIRITGHGLGSWTQSGKLKIAFGVAYLDRDDVSLLPAAGLIWTPSDSVRLNLLFPRPKLAWRMGFSEMAEDWCYVAGEFGGGSWAVQRVGGAADTLTIRDFRIALGFERKRDGGGGRRLEVAWVFGREFEYASGLGNFNPQDSLMARGVIAY